MDERECVSDYPTTPFQALETLLRWKDGRRIHNETLGHGWTILSQSTGRTGTFYVFYPQGRRTSYVLLHYDTYTDGGREMALIGTWKIDDESETIHPTGAANIRSSSGLSDEEKINEVLTYCKPVSPHNTLSNQPVWGLLVRMAREDKILHPTLEEQVKRMPGYEG